MTAAVEIRRSTAVVPTTDDLWSRWLANYRSARTQDAYRRDVTAWAAWCTARGVDVVHPLPGDVTAWMGELRAFGRAEATLARKVSAVRLFYRWARHEGVTDAHPEPFRRPRPNRDAVITLGLDPEQIHAVLDAALSRGDTRRNYAFVALPVFCGLRVSEALGADVTDLGSARGHRVISVVGKGDRPRTVPMPPVVVDAPSTYVCDRAGGPLFVTGTGRRWARRDAWETVVRIGARAGVAQLHPHTFRHTAVTLMLDAGAPLDRVQTVVGHASPATTMAYARARDRLDASPEYDLARYLAESASSA
jgi:site-specific recombinase XerD